MGSNVLLLLHVATIPQSWTLDGLVTKTQHQGHRVSLFSKHVGHIDWYSQRSLVARRKLSLTLIHKAEEDWFTNTDKDRSVQFAEE